MPGGFVGDAGAGPWAAGGGIATVCVVFFDARSRGAGVPKRALFNARTANTGAGVSGWSRIVVSSEGRQLPGLIDIPKVAIVGTHLDLARLARLNCAAAPTRSLLALVTRVRQLLELGRRVREDADFMIACLQKKNEGGEVVGVVLWRDRWVVMEADWIEGLVYSVSQTRPNLAARLLARHSQAILRQSWLVGRGAEGGLVGAPSPSDLPIVPSA